MRADLARPDLGAQAKKCRDGKHERAQQQWQLQL
jgi:hypothetical protein